MLRKLQACLIAVTGGLLVVTACSGKDGEGRKKPNPSDGGASDGGSGNDTSGKPGAHAGSAQGGHSGMPTAMAGADAGGEAGSGPMCPGCASGFCLEDGTCVDCLPSNDHCPDSSYCTDANTCAPGCKDGASCASGICAEDHSCANCINDDECSGGDVCGAGHCGPACTADQEGTSAECGSGLTCCSLHCSDLTTSSDHCGSCGASCASGQFCGLTECSASGEAGASSDAESCVTCHDTTLANLCAIGKVIVILDTNKNDSDGNRVPGRAIGTAIGAQCSPAPTVTEAEQDSVDALNFTTGRPVSNGGELLLVAGGPFYQNLEGYVEEHISPLYNKLEGTEQQFRLRSDDSVIVSQPLEGEHDSHDYFLMQFMRDAPSGSLVLNVQGFWLSGTTAASFLMINGVLPSLADYTKSWYVYRWTDQDGDLAPDLNEIEEVASG